MDQFGSQEDLDSALAMLQKEIDAGDWRTNERQARWIYEWYIFLAKQGANIRNFNAPLDFWIGAGDLQLDDNFSSDGDEPIQRPTVKDIDGRITDPKNPIFQGIYGQHDLDEAMDALQQIVDSGSWRDDPDIVEEIYDAYIWLASKGANVGNFKALEFWLGSEGLSSILDDESGTSLHGGNDKETTFDQEDSQPGPSQYPTIQCIQQEDEDDSNPGNSSIHTVEAPADHIDTDFSPEHFYRIYPSATPVYARKFNTERKQYTVSFRNTDQLTTADAEMELIFDSILAKIVDGFSPDDSTGLQINHPALDRPIYIPLTKISNLNGFKILNEIIRVMQSNTELRIDDNMEIITVSVRPPTGAGWKPRPINFDEWFDKSTSKIKIKNNDNLCMARAIVTAAAHVRKDPKRESINVGDQGNKTSLQKRLALELMQKAGLTNHNSQCGIPEAIAMQAVIKGEHRLKIFAHDQQAIIFKGASEARSEIFLYLKDNHYDVITSLTGFFNKSYWCSICDKGYGRLEGHKCRNTCSGCFRSPPCPNTGYIICNDCNRYFLSQQCFDTHKKTHIGHTINGNKKQKTETSICDRYKHCPDCAQFIKEANKKEHVCNSFECSICKKTMVKGEHKCYIQPINKPSDSDDDAGETDEEADDAGANLREAREAVITKYIFFDFETSQCTPAGENEQGPIFKHTVNLCIAHSVCEGCRNSDATMCQRCSPREKIFRGENCLNDFCKWLFTSGKKKVPVIAMAHNAKGFDGQFVLSYLEKQGHLKPTIIDKGLELMSIEAGHVKIMDSLNFLPMALKSLPKAFGVDELVKGYFPHLFNRPENWSYIGAWPAVHYYAPESMKEDERQAFEKWHTLQQEKIFNFEEEIVKYCRSDVDILRRAVLKFRDIFLDKTGVEPFDHSLTIASACNRVYRSLFLKPDTIGIIPHGGYRTKQRQSDIALKWIKWVSKTRNIHIEHARNGGEFRVEPHNFLADGHHGNEIFEFNGCYWHGCPTCMKESRHKTAEQQLTAGEAFTRTVRRRKIIENLGYTVTEIWECELERKLKADADMKQFFDSMKIVPPLDPREAFFGGRTNAVQLYACIERDEEGRPLERIDYTDICSLYPYICKYGRFPTGHPEIITENFEDLTNKPYEGLIKCKVVPPRQLLHPVLPYRSNGKLTFPLCASCADTMQTEPCQHDDEDRSILGCWVTLELYKALALGYKVTQIYEVYHYDEVAQYDPATKTGGLFAEYTNMFVKMKQQADGWPGWVQSNEDKDRYIDEYMAREGIQMDKDCIAKNPGLRSLAKLMLNSFWGKFGQRNNKRKAEYFKEPAKYFERITEAGRIIHSIRIINEHMVRVVSPMEDDFVEVLGNTNTVIAAYVTAQARLRLYSNIEQLGDRLIYFDTDSIIFKSQLHDNDQYRVPTGSYLGDMTNELKDYGDGAYIEEFVSSGPKCYGMKIYSPKDDNYHYTVKAKGFSLTSDIAKKINFDSLKELVYKYVKENITKTVSVTFNQIARLPDRSVVTKPMCKAYRVVYTKRVVLPDFTTLPYGYIV